MGNRPSIILGMIEYLVFHDGTYQGILDDTVVTSNGKVETCDDTVDPAVVSSYVVDAAVTLTDYHAESLHISLSGMQHSRQILNWS